MWFLFSGLNSQWPGMGKSLMKFTVFSLAVEKCQNALAHLGVDVKKLLTNDDSKSLNNIVHSIVAATAVQVNIDVIPILQIEQLLIKVTLYATAFSGWTSRCFAICRH